MSAKYNSLRSRTYGPYELSLRVSISSNNLMADAYGGGNQIILDVVEPPSPGYRRKLEHFLVEEAPLSCQFADHDCLNAATIRCQG